MRVSRSGPRLNDHAIGKIQAATALLPEGMRWRALCDAIADERVRRLARRQHQVVGSISQWADSTDVLDAARLWWEPLRGVYRAIADAG